MNYFYLDKCPFEMAKLMCDKHVVKMVLETAQMLSCAHHFYSTPQAKDLYKATHTNHPCTKWLRSSRLAYLHGCLHFLALLEEYTYRYGKVHASSKLMLPLSYVPEALPKTVLWVDPPQCMPEEHKQESTVLAYRSYYCAKAKSMATPMKFRGRQKPDWLI